jgi:hypothetical protein
MSITPAFSPGPQITQGAVVGSFFKVDARAFVGAMLGPHHREDAEFGQVRLAAERVENARIFLIAEAVLGHHLRRDLARHARALGDQSGFVRRARIMYR